MELAKEFIGQVVSLKYIERDVKTHYSKGKTKRYVLETLMKECKQGMVKTKDLHRVNLLMNKVDFDNHIIDIGDKIKIKNGRWLAKFLTYRIYDEKKLKGLKGTFLKTDEKGNIYYEVVVNSYILNSEDGDWEIKKKVSELNYATIPYSKIKFFITQEEFKEKILVFFLEDYEIEKIKLYNGNIVDFTYLRASNKIDSKKVYVKIIEEKNQVIFKEVENSES